jgi:MFS family permease
MKVMVIGSGGREHALAWKLAQSSDVDRLYVAPGNAGTEDLAENVPIKADNLDALVSFAQNNKIDLTMVGPDDPLAAGIAGTMATLGQSVLPKLGRLAMHIGIFVMAMGLIISSLVAHHYGLFVHSWQLIFGLLLVGVGMGCIFGTLFAAVLNDVDPQHAGSASGILNAVQQVGGAVGIALIGVIFFGQLNHGAAASFKSLQPQIETQLSAERVPDFAQALIISKTETCFVARSQEKDPSIIPPSCKAFTYSSKQGRGEAAIGKIVIGAADEANANNFSQAFRWAIIAEVALLLVILVISFLLPRQFRPEAYSEGV